MATITKRIKVILVPNQRYMGMENTLEMKGWPFLDLPLSQNIVWAVLVITKPINNNSTDRKWACKCRNSNVINLQLT